MNRSIHLLKELKKGDETSVPTTSPLLVQEIFNEEINENINSIENPLNINL